MEVSMHFAMYAERSEAKEHIRWLLLSLRIVELTLTTEE